MVSRRRTVRVLVTGGAGFIGAHVVKALLAEGAEPRILDLRSPGGREGSDVEHVVGDIRDAAVASRALDGVDAVCHQASMVGVERSFDDAAAYVSNNDVGTASLLTAMANVGFKGRFVLASSMVVYGEGRYRCERDGIVRPGPRDPADLASGRFDHACPHCGGSLEAEPLPEDARLEPRSVYAATKLHQEHLCRAYSRELGAPLTILRYHNVYGPGMPRNTSYAGVAAVFLSALEAGLAPDVFEDGRQLRDFVHVSDVARANAIALTRERAAVGVFNVASGAPRSVGEMASALSSAFGPAAPAPRVTGAFRLGDVRHVMGSPERAARDLGFTARIEFGQGLLDLVAHVGPGSSRDTGFGGSDGRTARRSVVRG